MGSAPRDSSEPMRGELFAPERLELFASSLAATHAFTGKQVRGRGLLERLAHNRKILLASYQSTVKAVQERRWITPAADWLINNFHVIQEQLREAREDLPIAYYRDLPKLVGGPFSGLPRVYGMAVEFITHSDGKLEIETLERFVTAYQAVAPLGMGEVWAIPIALRAAYIENLARIAVKVDRARDERNAASALAAELIKATAQGAQEIRSILHQRVARRQAPSTTMFVTELLLRLRDQDPAMEQALEWLENRISEQGTTVDEAVRFEHRSQAQNQVSVGNAITSMRLITATDWTKFFERMSAVDAVLREDPSLFYPQMEFASRDHYRHIIEKIAKRTGVDEVTVARGAIQLARDAGDASDLRRTHVGFYLLDRGRASFEAATGYRPSAGEHATAFVLRHPALVYLVSLTAMTTGAIAAAELYSRTFAPAPSLGLLVAALVAVPASELALSLLNLAVTALLPPAALAKLDFRKGIPTTCRTFVVVPTMLTSASGVAEMLEALEVRYLANQDPCLHFALLTDFADHSEPHAPGDAELLDAARKGIVQLNERHGASNDRFYLFHRARVFSESEQCFIGWERKRGKLVEFNRLLLGEGPTTFTDIVGDQTVLRDVRYVLTLDSDTRLPRDTAARLVGTIAHPLNAPEVDARTRTVSKGHGIIQPRVSVTLESAVQSPFARIFSAQGGVDPYTTAVSDVYQDLFDEGSFVGKGIYDVRTFEQTLEGRFPADTILSHDLLEGSLARSALAADIELFDDTPSQYIAHAMRRHRWTRGDWQIASWMFPWTSEQRGLTKNVLGYLARWKIADNLRRSLLAPTLVALLLVAWLGFLGPARFWTAVVVLLVAFPAYARLTTSAISAPRGITLPSYLGNLTAETARNGAQALLTLTFLPHQAWVSLDAILRALFRRIVTHRKLLEWTPAAVVAQNGSLKLLAHYRRMWASPVLAVGVAAFLVWHPRGSLPLAAPFLLAWLVAPAIAARLSRPTVDTTPRLDADDLRFLRMTVRRTWRFFEAFVSAADNYLPPDNFQESPSPVLARRTSPTNIGLSLLANVVAVDRGYATLSECSIAVEKTLSSMQRLDRYRGHFLNWYDTSNLKPLLPHYVSTVDSGNLAGYLLTLKQALLQAPSRPLLGQHVVSGMIETLWLLQSETETLLADELPSRNQLLRPVYDSTLATVAELEKVRFELRHWPATLADLADRAADILGRVDVARAESKGADLDELTFYARSFERQVTARRAEIETLIPWLLLLPASAKTAWQKGMEALLSAKASVSVDDLLILSSEVARINQGGPNGDDVAGLRELRDAAARSVEALGALPAKLAVLANTANLLLEDMDFSFLYDQERKVFSIGYNVGEARLDHSFYDLLASESRLASFVAIAKGDVPGAHWYRLGRPLTQAGGGRALLSWTGTMFEYLMPCLVMKSYAGTLLDSTYRAVIQRQIEYAEQCGVPWGTSEAAYNARDLKLNYQYAPFGVPGLGIKRGLGDDTVVAPYATALALLFTPVQAVQNLRRLAAAGAAGKYGFYESIDYTRSRVPDGELGAVVQAFMAHHQGMILVALAEYLDVGPMRERFHSEPRVQATQLLLQERIPHHVPLAELNQQETQVVRSLLSAAPNKYRVAFDEDAAPEAQLLSNGSYSLMITTSGAGYSRCRGLAVTRWREDATRDHWGQFCYLRDVESGRAWSTTHQPTLSKPQSYDVDFHLDKVEFRRLENGIASLATVLVTAEDDAEIRSIKLTNRSLVARELDVTTYAEVVLAKPSTDTAHPAFGNLFVETEFVSETGALLATRRKRSADDVSVWAVHVSAVESHGSVVGPVEYETDRLRFLGRGNGPDAPHAVFGGEKLSNTVGPVLDPIFSLRRRVKIGPGESVEVSFTTAVAESREHALLVAEKYQAAGASIRASALAWTSARAQLHYLDVRSEDTQVFAMLASRLAYANRDMRASPELLARNVLSQANLWAYGISGDLPILAVCVSEDAHVDLVRELLHAHEYCRLRGFEIDLVVVNDHSSSYLQSFQDNILSVVRSSLAHDRLDRPGGIFVVRSDLIPPADRTLILTVARVVLLGERGMLSEQIEQQPGAQALPPALKPAMHAKPRGASSVPPHRNTEFFNGWGGFTEDGSEYLMALAPDQWTPLPWSNVIANEKFGTLVTESGGGYSWCENSRENRLTPWSNDAVTDAVSEAIYIRDEDTGAYHTPTPLPVRGGETYNVRHGQGYSVFESASREIEQHLVVFVPNEDTVKVSKLSLHNRGNSPRHLTVTYYVDWTLGIQRELSGPFVVTSVDPTSSLLFAKNAYNNEFADRVAFVGTNAPLRSFTGDRAEFIGRGRNLGRPAALGREMLAGQVGAGFDPCGAIQVDVDLAPGEQRVLVFLLGEGKNLEDVQAIAARYRTESHASAALDEVCRHWDELLQTITVKTPDTPFDFLVNRWLLYQTLSCRVFGRTGFYQSGGAYGFRDQLQDVAALVYAAPGVAREQLLRAAARQFVEGDVQHWWHPPTGRGVRTRFSDDLLWLPCVLLHYLEVTGDGAILEEVVPFIEAPALKEEEEDSYLVPVVSKETGTIYEHCTRAIERSLRTGAHGLPLIGSGDWNDGMNRVGRQGRGESVWLGWFLAATLTKFASICEARHDVARARRYLAHAQELNSALESSWDGAWYRRAYLDDGTPIGSAQSEECKIDSLPQSWSVISGMGNPERQLKAMASVEQHLVKHDDELVLLLTPPFDKGSIDPGYIKGYVPGVRENGGQYTHAATWVILAYALMGDGDRAGELFAMLNPVNHTADRGSVDRYKVEPYVVAGDVYDVPPHVGRGGWTWYTGASGWMYRVAIEAILGFQLRGDRLTIDPCIPSTWPGFSMTYRYRRTTYRIVVENPDGVCSGCRALVLDGDSILPGAIALIDDGGEHDLRVTLGRDRNGAPPVHTPLHDKT